MPSGFKSLAVFRERVLGEGTDAPTFTLPGVVDGAPRDVDIDDYLGKDILVLAFYPADFSPACDEDSCDLTELDLFTMQQDVEVFGISPDSVFSHKRFAEEYSLSTPLLSDSYGEVIEQYDIGLDSDQLLAKRAVFVIDQEGTIQYTWSTDDMRRLPNVDKVREAVSAIGGDSTAIGRYRVGHAHYIEGRRAFTSAMNSYEDRDWLIAQGDFERAMEEFQEAAEQFQSAVRFAESEELEFGFTRAQEKATALWQAAEWLSESSSHFSSGDGEEGDELRKDAESPLKTARDIGEPPNPDDIQVDDGSDDAPADPTTPNDETTDGDTTADDDTELDTPEQSDGDESADESIEQPTDPAEDEDTATPGGDVEDGGADSDINAAVQEVEAELQGDDASDASDQTGGVTIDDTGPVETADDGVTVSGIEVGDDTADTNGSETVASEAADGGGTDGTAADDEEGDSDEDIELDLDDPTE